ncbi:MAG: hypothetical protein ACK5QX_11530 [bacterium]
MGGTLPKASAGSSTGNSPTTLDTRVRVDAVTNQRSPVSRSPARCSPVARACVMVHVEGVTPFAGVYVIVSGLVPPQANSQPPEGREPSGIEVLPVPSNTGGSAGQSSVPPSTASHTMSQSREGMVRPGALGISDQTMLSATHRVWTPGRSAVRMLRIASASAASTVAMAAGRSVSVASGTRSVMPPRRGSGACREPTTGASRPGTPVTVRCPRGAVRKPLSRTGRAPAMLVTGRLSIQILTTPPREVGRPVWSAGPFARPPRPARGRDR